jgi:hypothetical protein
MATCIYTGSARKKILLPVFLLCLGCFSDCIAQQFTNFWNGRLLQGNRIAFSSLKIDTTTISDSGGTEQNYIYHAPRPQALNGKEIQHGIVNEYGTSPKTIALSSDQFSKYLIDSLKPLLEQLGDGEYAYSPFYAIVNEYGLLAYYEMKEGIWKTAKPFPGATMEQIQLSRNIDKKLKDAIDKKVASLSEHCPKFEILYVNGAAMPYDLGSYSLSVKDHHLQ